MALTEAGRVVSDEARAMVDRYAALREQLRARTSLETGVPGGASSARFRVPVMPYLCMLAGVGLSLALNEFIPWDKVIMRQAADIGSRFFRLRESVKREKNSKSIVSR